MGAEKVRYVPRNQADQTFLAAYPGILRDIPEVPEKFEKKKVSVQFSFPIKKEKDTKLRNSLGTPAGRPWDTRRDKQGSTGRCPRDFLSLTFKKWTEKSFSAGTPAGCPKHTLPSRGFSEILGDFLTVVAKIIPQENYAF